MSSASSLLWGRPSHRKDRIEKEELLPLCAVIFISMGDRVISQSLSATWRHTAFFRLIRKFLTTRWRRYFRPYRLYIFLISITSRSSHVICPYGFCNTIMILVAWYSLSCMGIATSTCRNKQLFLLLKCYV